MKKLLFFACFLIFSGNVLSESINIKGQEHEKLPGTSDFYVPKKLNIDLYVDIFGPFAVKEYFNGNYGLAKDMLEYIASRTNTYPKAFFFLGEIYSDIDVFKNKEMAKSNYLKFVKNKNNKNVLATQRSYIRLSELCDNVNDKLMYATKASEIHESVSSLRVVYDINKSLFTQTKKQEYKNKMKEILVKMDRVQSAPYFNRASLNRN